MLIDAEMMAFEMVRRIRQTDKQIPVLFLTARSAINDVVEGFELGANDYLKNLSHTRADYPNQSTDGKGLFSSQRTRLPIILR